MSDIPHYREQPATLDERVEIPDNAPLAQGHTEEKAADVADALDAHKEAIEESAKNPEVGPGDPAQPPEPEPEPKKAAAKKSDS